MTFHPSWINNSFPYEIIFWRRFPLLLITSFWQCGILCFAISRQLYCPGKVFVIRRCHSSECGIASGSLSALSRHSVKVTRRLPSINRVRFPDAIGVYVAFGHNSPGALVLFTHTMGTQTRFICLSHCQRRFVKGFRTYENIDC